MGIGGPDYHHVLTLGYGAATPDNRLSGYWSFEGAGTGYDYGNGLYPAWELHRGDADVLQQTDREFTSNIVYKFAKNNSDSLQFFYDSAYHQQNGGYAGTYQQWTCNPLESMTCVTAINPATGSAYDENANCDASASTCAQDGFTQGLCFASCDNREDFFWTGYLAPAQVYNGQNLCEPWDTNTNPQTCAYRLPNPNLPNGNPFSTPSDYLALASLYDHMMPLAAGQTQSNQTLLQAGQAPYTYGESPKTYKFEFTKSFDPTTYLELSYANSDTFSTYNNLVSSGDHYSVIGGIDDTLQATLTKSIGDKHVIKAGALFGVANSSVTAHGADDLLWDLNGAAATGEGWSNQVYDFISPNSPLCQIGWDWTGKSYCGYLYQYMQPQNGGQTLPLPVRERISYGHPDTTGGFITDTITPGEHWLFSVGAREDHVHYNLPPIGLDPTTCTSLYLPSWQQPNDPVLNASATAWGLTSGMLNGKPIGPGNCPQTIFPASYYQAIHPSVFEPRMTATWKEKDSAIKFSFGTNARFASNHDMEGAYGAQIDPAEFAPYSKIPAYYSPGVCWYFGFCYNPTIGPSGSPLNEEAAGPDVGWYGDMNLQNGCSNAAGSKNLCFPYIPGPPDTCGLRGFWVPCQNYGEQMFWNTEISDGGNSGVLTPILPTISNNWEVSVSHQFTKGRLAGIGFSLTGYSRRDYQLETITTPVEVGPDGKPVLNPNGTVKYLSPTITSDGIGLTNGVELYLTKMRNVGLSTIFSATYTNARTNVPPPGGDGFSVVETTPATLALHDMYRVSYVSPLVTSLTWSYRTKGQWRASLHGQWNLGFPVGSGNYGPVLINGQPVNVLNTNVSNPYAPVSPGYPGSPGYSSGLPPPNYVDPVNPGSYLHPVIAATRGTDEGQYPGSKLSPSYSMWDFTLAKELHGGDSEVGVSLYNLFDETSYGAWENGIPGSGYTYQAVATGVSGPKTNASWTSNGPQTYPASFHMYDPYINIPGAEGRNFYFFFKTKV